LETSSNATQETTYQRSCFFLCNVRSSPACAGEPHADRPATLSFLAFKPHNRNVAHPGEIHQKLAISQGRQGATLHKIRIPRLPARWSQVLILPSEINFYPIILNPFTLLACCCSPRLCVFAGLIFPNRNVAHQVQRYTRSSISMWSVTCGLPQYGLL
jgi:hypothetical protein